MREFARNAPMGSTNLAAALDEAFKDHFSGTKGATTILVITDGEPDDREQVKAVIRKAADSLEYDVELSISFLQIGDDRTAAEFLVCLYSYAQHTYDDLFCCNYLIHNR